MKFQFLTASLTVSGVFVQQVLTAPTELVTSEVDIIERNSSALVKRGGYHRASVYTSEICSGQAIMDVENFGCGGVCHGLAYGYSILLRQQTTRNPKPTANLYYSTDCTGGHSSAGIWSGHLSGCTGNSASEGWRSVYLYYNC